MYENGHRQKATRTLGNLNQQAMLEGELENWINVSTRSLICALYTLVDVENGQISILLLQRTIHNITRKQDVVRVIGSSRLSAKRVSMCHSVNILR